MKFARLIGYGLFAASLVYFARAAWIHASALPAIDWNVAVIAALLCVILLYMGQFVTTGLAWDRWLTAVGEPTRPRRAIILLMLSQFAKYVPGSVAQHIARVALARHYGISGTGTVLTIGLEIGWSLAAGMSVAVIAMTYLGLPLIKGVAVPAPATILLILAVAVLVPSFGIWLSGRNRPALMDRLLGTRQLAHPGPGTVIACFLLYGLNHVICGLILALLATQLFGAAEAHCLQAIGVFAIAWMAGLIVLVSPGGIGVRESVLLAGLTPAYGPGTALGVAIAYRVVTSLGDGLGFLLGYMAERRLARAGVAPARQNPVGGGKAGDA